MSSVNSINKRIFPRYQLDLDIPVIIEGKEIIAKLIDFSIGGVGIVIKDPSLLKSESFDIKIKEIDFDTKARVAWEEDIFSGKKIGIQRIGPIQGNLRNVRLSDLFVGIQKSGKTGILKIGAESFTKRIYFNKGDVTFSASDQDKERMGDMLLDIGKITRDDYNKSVAIMKQSGKRQGAALVELGCLKPDDLIWAVRYQVEKIILDLFNLAEGNLFFHDTSLSLNEVITLKLSTANLIYRGIKSINSYEFIKGNFPPLDSILCFSSEPLKLFQEIILEENDKKIFSLIDGSRMLEDIIARSPLKKEETMRTIYGLLNTQIIEIVQSGEAVSSVVREDILEQPEQEVDSAVVDKIESLYRDHKSLGHSGVLNVSRNATADEIKRAYHRMAREFHPDRHLHFQTDTLKEKLNTIFAYINESYRVLTQPQNILQADSATHAGVKYRDDKKITAKMKFSEGLSYLKKKNYEQALIFLGQALYLDNSISGYHFYYGIALLKNKRIKDAEDSIKKALQFEPYNSEYVAELGHLYLQLGFKTRAKNTFEKALKYDSFNERASEGLEKLRS
jgi:curved DNA-binding protein CbpA